MSSAALSRQACVHQQQVIAYDELARDGKASEEYRALPAKVAQWALFQAPRQAPLAWKRSVAACVAWEGNPSRFQAHPSGGHWRVQYPTQRSPERCWHWERGCGRSPGQDRPGQWVTWQHCPCRLDYTDGDGV